MSEYYWTRDDELYHYGVAGQKWGRRQYQNEDGSLTELGRQHYGYGPARERLYNAKNAYNIANRKALDATKKASSLGNLFNRDKALKRETYAKGMATKANKAKQEYLDAKKAYRNSDEHKAKVKKAIKIGAAVAGTALAAYGAYRLSQYVNNKRITKGRGMLATEQMQKTLKEKYFAIGMRSKAETNEKSSYYYDKAKELNETISNNHPKVEKYSNRMLNKAERGVNRSFAGMDARRKLDSGAKAVKNKFDSGAKAAKSKFDSARQTAKLKSTERSIARELNSAPRKASLQVAKNRVTRTAGNVANKVSTARSTAQKNKVDKLYNEFRGLNSRARYYRDRSMNGSLSSESRATANREYSKALNDMQNIKRQLEAINMANTRRANRRG